MKEHVPPEVIRWRVLGPESKYRQRSVRLPPHYWTFLEHRARVDRAVSVNALLRRYVTAAMLEDEAWMHRVESQGEHLDRGRPDH